jgi:hypothetical protein
MQLLRVVLVLAAVAAVTGQYLQERYRLATLDRLSGREARDRHEARRRGSERLMVVLAAGATIAGLVAVADLVLHG